MPFFLLQRSSHLFIAITLEDRLYSLHCMTKETVPQEGQSELSKIIDLFKITDPALLPR